MSSSETVLNNDAQAHPYAHTGTKYPITILNLREFCLKFVPCHIHVIRPHDVSVRFQHQFSFLLSRQLSCVMNDRLMINPQAADQGLPHFDAHEPCKKKIGQSLVIIDR